MAKPASRLSDLNAYPIPGHDQTIGYPLDAEGAGDSPTGLPASLREYKQL